MRGFQVDFQEGFYGSPGIDLNWFFLTSCNQDILTNQLEELIEIYHRTLFLTLEKLNYQKTKPTLIDIKNEIEKKSHHGKYLPRAVDVLKNINLLNSNKNRFGHTFVYDSNIFK